MRSIIEQKKVSSLQAVCDRFNEAYPVGTSVTVRLDGRREPFATVTRSIAKVLSGHSAVIWLENVTGCYLLDRVTPIRPTDESEWPMQPIVLAADGITRFQENRIISKILKHSAENGLGLNELAHMPFTNAERMQLAQLLGYSVSGYGDLSYASEQSVRTADAMSEQILAKTGGRT